MSASRVLRILAVHGAGRGMQLTKPGPVSLAWEQCEVEFGIAIAALNGAGAGGGLASGQPLAASSASSASSLVGHVHPQPLPSAVFSHLKGLWFHSNREGDLIDRLYAACNEDIQAALIIPGHFVNGYHALAHTLEEVSQVFPTIALLPDHFSAYSNPATPFLPSKCSAVVSGLGLGVYSVGLSAAIRLVAQRLPAHHATSAHPHAPKTSTTSALALPQPPHPPTPPSPTSDTGAEPRPRSKIVGASLDELFPHPSEAFYQPQKADLAKIPSWLLAHVSSTDTKQLGGTASPGASGIQPNGLPSPLSGSAAAARSPLQSDASKVAHTNPQYYQSLQFELSRRAAGTDDAPHPSFAQTLPSSLEGGRRNSYTDFPDSAAPSASASPSSLSSLMDPSLQHVPLHHQHSRADESPSLSATSRHQSVDWEDDFAELVEPSVNKLNSARNKDRATHNSDRDSYIDELFFPQLYGKDTR